MDEKTLIKIKQQHIDNYKKAVIENIKNNTNVLIDEDILSLFRRPPLDSMDSIKMKLLTLAKKNKIVLDASKIDKILDNYRNNLIKCCDEIKNIRIKGLSNTVNKISLKETTDVIKINKKDFISINKEMKKIIKDSIFSSFEKCVLNDISSIFVKDTDVDICNKIKDEVTKYVKSSYQKQLFENIDIKILVKDTTLINSIKELSERHQFTMSHSRLFQD